MKSSSPFNILPPEEITAALAAGSKLDQDSKLSLVLSLGKNTGYAANSYIGLPLHQGNLPFITLNGVHITFSPFLILFLGAVGAASLYAIDTMPLNFVPMALVILLLLSQLVGNICSGWLVGLKPQSLILSLSGVIDPALIFEQTPKIYSHSTDENTSENISEENLSTIKMALDDINLQALKEYHYTPLRAMGSSLGALIFLLTITLSPFGSLLIDQSITNPANTNTEWQSILINVFWVYGCFVVIAPFLPPHRLHPNIKYQLANAIAPVFMLGIFASITSDQLFFKLGGNEIIFFIFALALRAFWWKRISQISKVADKLSFAEAMLPLDELKIFNHGQTTTDAQHQALTSAQPIFPIVSGQKLIGYIQKDRLIRTPLLEDENELVTALASPASTFIDSQASLSFAFAPQFSMPAFVMHDGNIVGIITTEQIRDSLILALSGNPKMNKNK